MADDDLKELRDNLLNCCVGYTGDDAVRALASAMMTILLGTTRNQAASRLIPVLRELVDDIARPAGSGNERRPP